MRHFITILLLFISINLYSQSPSWVNTISSISKDEAYSTDKDNIGNIYFSGRFSGTADFDPSVTVFNLTSNGLTDGYLAKYTPNGQLIWAFIIGGTSQDAILKVKVNNAGEIITTGYYRNNVDFDPGIGTFFMNGSGQGGTDNGWSGDIFVAKYSNSGTFIWAFEIRGSYCHDQADGIDVDNNDNIYLAGAVNATSTYPIDADPGPAVFDIGGVGHGHAFVAKYTTNGNFVWAFNFGEYGMNSGARNIQVVPGDTTFVVTGFYRGTNIDFDPNAGSYLLSSNGVEDLMVAKYSINKQFIWAYSTGGIGVDVALGLAVDNNNDVYVSGFFNGANIDFDPSSTIVNSLTSLGGWDAYIFKYSKNGYYMWAKSFGNILDDTEYGLSLEGNELLLTGGFRNTVDFDPSMAVFNLSSNGGSDIYISRFDTIGNFLCAEKIGGIQDEFGYSIQHISTDTFIICGNYNSNNLDFDPSLSSLIKINAGQEDAFLGKYTTTNLSTSLNPSMIGDTVCTGVSPSLTINFGSGFPGPFNIVLNDGAINQAYTGILSGVPFSPSPMPTLTTTYTLISVTPIIAACNGINIPASISATLAILPSPSISAIASPSSPCIGSTTTLNGAGALSYSWSNGITDGVPFNILSLTTYTVTGTDANGCTNSISITVNVTPPPAVIAFASPQSVCEGGSTTLTGSGALSYQWTGGVVNGISFLPASTSTYTVTGTDANGCSNTSSITITVSPLPVVSATVNPSVVCQGLPVIFTGGGALSYFWSGGVNDGIPFYPLVSGTYSVFGIGANGCANTDTVSVNVLPAPMVFASASPAILCENDFTTLNASGAISYSWSGGVLNATPFIPAASTTYTVTGTAANACTSTATVSLDVHIINLSVAVTDPVLCMGDSTQLIASGADTYMWSPMTNMSSAFVPNPIIFPVASTIYTVTGTDAIGCTGTSTVEIEVIPKPTLIVSKSSDVECGMNTIQLSVTGGNNYSWSPASMLSSPNAALTNATVLQSTTFYVNGTIGSCIVTDSIQVSVFKNDETDIHIPNAFSPNNDGNNDCVKIISRAHFTTYYFAFYNRWGQRIFETNVPEDCWDGVWKGEKAPMDTYYYYLQGETRCGKIFKKGDVTLLR